MKLTWSAFALSDRDAIFTYIEAENPSAAILVDERIAAAVRRLIDFPASGRVGRIAGTRELVINGTPYVAAYSFNETAV
ncbi:type II toxin-antitoxin system RelE/ParE family toxin, partial [Rhizobium sp. Pop5]|uniref:type II toxin-antitoxin system RelE/ParE family toxin n=1 Tax=Rhizobium sp. Pop5 TaxID=1223565 RepID=UPI000283B390